MSWGVSVQGLSVQGASDRGVCVLGVGVQGVSVQGVSDQGVCVIGIRVRGVHVWGGSVLSPFRLCLYQYSIQYKIVSTDASYKFTKQPFIRTI